MFILAALHLHHRYIAILSIIKVITSTSIFETWTKQLGSRVPFRTALCQPVHMHNRHPWVKALLVISGSTTRRFLQLFLFFF